MDNSSNQCAVDSSGWIFLAFYALCFIEKKSGGEAKEKNPENASNQFTIGCKSIPGDSKTVHSETSDNNVGTILCKPLAADSSETTIDGNYNYGII